MLQSWETPITHHPWAAPGFPLPSKHIREDDWAWELLPPASPPSGYPPWGSATQYICFALYTHDFISLFEIGSYKKIEFFFFLKKYYPLQNVT